jgi:hypothetical protein
MKKTHLKSAPTTASEIDFEDAVHEAKQILDRIDSNRMRLGELAHKLEPRHGEQTLLHFAREIGVAVCTLARHRDVYRAWEGFCAPGRKLGYAVARELATHPDRGEIVRSNPAITKREAQARMRAYRKSVSAPPADPTVEDPAEALPAYQRSLLLRARKAIAAAQVEDWAEFDLENYQMEMEVDAALVQVAKQAAQDWARVADCLEQLLEDQEQQLSEPHDVAAEPALKAAA